MAVTPRPPRVPGVPYVEPVKPSIFQMIIGYTAIVLMCVLWYGVPFFSAIFILWFIGQ